MRFVCAFCVCVYVGEDILFYRHVSFWAYIVRAGFSTLYSLWLKIYFQEQIQISSTTWCYFAAFFFFFVFSPVKLVVKSHPFCGYPGLWWVLQYLLVLAQRNILYPLKRKGVQDIKGFLHVLRDCLPGHSSSKNTLPHNFCSSVFLSKSYQSLLTKPLQTLEHKYNLDAAQVSLFYHRNQLEVINPYKTAYLFITA